MSWGDKTYEERRSSIVYHNRCHSGSREFISSSTRPTYRRYSWVFFFFILLYRLTILASSIFISVYAVSFTWHPCQVSVCKCTVSLWTLQIAQSILKLIRFYFSILIHFPSRLCLFHFVFFSWKIGGGGQDFHVAFNFFFQESKIEFNLFFSHFGFYYQLIYSTKYVCPNLIF